VTLTESAEAGPEAGRPGFSPLETPPETLFLSLPASDICNYRCRHCHIWMQEKRADLLPAERRRELIEEFAAWNPGGTVILPGGEVTLEPEELLPVTAACRQHGLTLILLTNGSRIQDRASAELVAGSGATHVVVSLDSHRAELHNYTRGVPTAFDETTRAIRELVAARDRGAGPIRVMTAGVLFKENLPEFPDYVEFCRELGVDHVDFQLLARTFANRSRGRDVFFDKHFWHTEAEKAEARRLIAGLVDRYAADPQVVKKQSDLDWMLAYVTDPDFATEDPVCGSHRRNLLVDAAGNAALCFNTVAILDAPFVGNVRDASLAELWASPKAQQDRALMDRCTLNCGALNCHRRKAESQ